MQTDDLEQKKLVYLYLMNYAKTQPELVILAVNTFVKDSDDPNPLVRALAIRTMGCLRAEKIIDYLCDPLQKCLRDENPYVRKTAALCVAKLYDLKPELVIENGFLQQLHDMISDSNPMVSLNLCLRKRNQLTHTRSSPTQLRPSRISTSQPPPCHPRHQQIQLSSLSPPQC
jgi:AP-1 complex subunit beta-1